MIAEVNEYFILIIDYNSSSVEIAMGNGYQNSIHLARYDLTFHKLSRDTCD